MIDLCEHPPHRNWEASTGCGRKCKQKVDDSLLSHQNGECNITDDEIAKCWKVVPPVTKQRERE